MWNMVINMFSCKWLGYMVRGGTADYSREDHSIQWVLSYLPPPTLRQSQAAYQLCCSPPGRSSSGPRKPSRALPP